MDTREDPPIVTCPHCGANVPAGEFCGRCGAHLATGSPRRSHVFAAVPNQRVAHLAIVSTLFPHLAYRRSGPFRVAIVAGVAVVGCMGGLPLFLPSRVAEGLRFFIPSLMYVSKL